MNVRLGKLASVVEVSTRALLLASLCVVEKARADPCVRMLCQMSGEMGLGLTGGLTVIPRTYSHVASGRMQSGSAVRLRNWQ